MVYFKMEQLITDHYPEDMPATDATREITGQEGYLKAIANIRSAINQELERLFLDKYSARTNTLPMQVARHITLAGGHRWRGLIAIATGNIFIGEDSFRRCMPGALSVELAHAASMLLDDLPSMDDAELRRGRQCAHLVFPRWAVDLAPALMTSMAFEVALTETPAPPELRVRAAQVSAETAAMMAEGQEFDLSILSQQASESQLMQCYLLKSGSLYSCAAKNAAIVSNANEDEIEQCTACGMQLGIAYQLMDDIADLEGDPSLTGKNPCMDHGKATSISVFGVERVRAMARQLQDEAESYLTRFGSEADLLRVLIRRVTWATA